MVVKLSLPIARWRDTETPSNGMLLLTSVAVRLNDWLTVTFTGPINVSVGEMPLELKTSMDEAVCDKSEVPEGSDEGCAPEGSLGVEDGSGEGVTLGDGVGVAGGALTLTLTSLLV
jgi:hypothetical protein